jgi:hypothetical protein
VPSLPVKPELGPTLPQLLARAPRLVRVAAAAAAVLVVVVLVAGLLGGAASTGETHVVVRDRPAFNLRYGALERVPADGGATLALEARRGDLFLQSFRVVPMTLRPYKGVPSGELPVVAEELKQRLARRFADFSLLEEGRARINEQPGYEVVFSAHSEEGRRLYGRWVMVVPDTPGAREGVTLELLGTPAAGIPNADQIGDEGQLKLPMRSFRFGTEAP